VEITKLQNLLLQQKQVLIYLSDVKPSHPHWNALQRAGGYGFFPTLDARPDEAINEATAKEWARLRSLPSPPPFTGKTRAEYAAVLMEMP
jgi:hypothetical protein